MTLFQLQRTSKLIVFTTIFFLNPLTSWTFGINHLRQSTSRCDGVLDMVAGVEKKTYVPKWVKKETLADQMGGATPEKVGLTGNVPVLFKMGNETKRTMAFSGQPLRDVASQAGQFIKYGCGKGECGSCECMCNGKWIRPCIATVPLNWESSQGDYTIQLKEMKTKTVSSGKFYSVRSFFMGFYNNLLGMVGFVLTSRSARKNYKERMEYEAMVERITAEKKAARLKAESAKQ